MLSPLERETAELSTARTLGEMQRRKTLQNCGLQLWEPPGMGMRGSAAGSPSLTTAQAAEQLGENIFKGTAGLVV